MNTNKYNSHIFALCSLFVLGNTFISNTFFENGFFYNLIFSVLASGLTILTCCLINFSHKSRKIQLVLFTLLFPLALWSVITTFFDFVRFLSRAQMPQTNIFLILFVTLAVIGAFCTHKILTIYKFCLLVAVVGLLFFIICFIGGIKNLGLDHFKYCFNRGKFDINVFIKFFLPIVIIPVFLSLEFKKIPTKSIIGGTITGFLILGLCFFQAILTLGLRHNAEFPYLTAVGVISSGSLFTRLDGFVYFLFFISSLTKIVVCIKFMLFTFGAKRKNVCKI